MSEIIYLNGQLLPRESARISPFDHGFLYGYGLFETVRAYPSTHSMDSGQAGSEPALSAAKGQRPAKGVSRLFLLERHLRRLRASAKALGIEGLPPDEELSRAAYAVLEANGLPDVSGRLRITVSLGPGEITPEPPAHVEPTVFIAAHAFSPPTAQAYEAGYSAVIFPHRVGSQSTLGQHKSSSYLLHLVARTHARAEGAHEALLISEDGLLLEASTANLFLVSQGQLMTAPVSAGVLPGITRETVLEMASVLGMAAQEIALPVEALGVVEEAFLTSSLLGIMPLTRVGGQPIGTGKAGPVTQQLMRTYDLLVKRETGAL